MPPRATAMAVVAVVAVAAAGALVYALDPTRYWLTPPCPYLVLTGFACPGCGLTRALHFALHGDLGRAFALNPWSFVSGPALLAFVALPWVTDSPRSTALRTTIAWTMLVVTVAFWIWRNTPSYPFVRI